MAHGSYTSGTVTWRLIDFQPDAVCDGPRGWSDQLFVGNLLIRSITELQGESLALQRGEDVKRLIVPL